MLIAARNLNSADLPSQSFVNRHIVYTHGYGVVSSPSNEALVDGTPDFYLKDIPTLDQGIKLSAKQPSQIYFGENLSSYVLTGAESREFNYQTAGKTDQFTRYKGKDGVTMSNWLRRAAFTLKFSDFNLLLSGQINSDTKLLMDRDIRDRVGSSRRSSVSTAIRIRSRSGTRPSGCSTATPRRACTRTPSRRAARTVSAVTSTTRATR